MRLPDFLPGVRGRGFSRFGVGEGGAGWKRRRLGREQRLWPGARRGGRERRGRDVEEAAPDLLGVELGLDVALHLIEGAAELAVPFAERPGELREPLWPDDDEGDHANKHYLLHANPKHDLPPARRQRAPCMVEPSPHGSQESPASQCSGAVSSFKFLTLATRAVRVTGVSGSILGGGESSGRLGGRGVTITICLLIFVTIGGTIGYVTIEGWGLLDAFYMTVISLTSVGFGEVHPLTPQGKLFTVLVILGGVGIVAMALGYGSRIVLEGQLERIMGRRRMEKEIARLRDHYVICGYGRMGRVITREFLKKPVPFVVVEQDAEIFKSIDPGVLAICGNAEEDAVLEAAGIERARGLVSVVSSDADNVYITLTAAGLRPDLYIVARAGDESAERKLLRAGASKVISPYAIGGVGIANAILRPAVVDFIELVTRREHLELQMEEVLVAPTSSLAGRSILATGLRQQYGAIVVAIKKGNDLMQFNPAPEHLIEVGDRLIILGAGEKLDQIALLATR